MTAWFVACADGCGAMVFASISRYAGRFHCGGCELVHLKKAGFSEPKGQP